MDSKNSVIDQIVLKCDNDYLCIVWELIKHFFVYIVVIFIIVVSFILYYNNYNYKKKYYDFIKNPIIPNKCDNSTCDPILDEQNNCDINGTCNSGYCIS